MTPPQIRRALAADAPSIVALADALQREEGHDGAALTEADVMANAIGDDPRLIIFLAEDQGQPLGFATCFASFDCEHAARGAYLGDLYVVPDARRQGLGRALVAAVARHCQTEGGIYLFWNALIDNRAARAFYRRIGAREEPVVTLSLQPDALKRLAALPVTPAGR